MTNHSSGDAEMTERPDCSPRKGPSPDGGVVYGLGMIGAAAYFFSSAQSRRDYALAVPKAAIWPTLLVYQLFKRTDV
ncbi:MAG: hypothetical protein WCP28_08370 [Actinomycetes bacterium]